MALKEVLEENASGDVDAEEPEFDDEAFDGLESADDI